MTNYCYSYFKILNKKQYMKFITENMYTIDKKHGNLVLNLINNNKLCMKNIELDFNSDIIVKFNSKLNFPCFTFYYEDNRHEIYNIKSSYVLLYYDYNTDLAIITPLLKSSVFYLTSTSPIIIPGRTLEMADYSYSEIYSYYVFVNDNSGKLHYKIKDYNIELREIMKKWKIIE